MPIKRSEVIYILTRVVAAPLERVGHEDDAEEDGAADDEDDGHNEGDAGHAGQDLEVGGGRGGEGGEGGRGAGGLAVRARASRLALE